MNLKLAASEHGINWPSEVEDIVRRFSETCN